VASWWQLAAWCFAWRRGALQVMDGLLAEAEASEQQAEQQQAAAAAAAAKKAAKRKLQVRRRWALLRRQAPLGHGL
jgi:hypothetical protein